MSSIASPRGFGLFLLEALGQIWYVAAGTLGLAVVGVWVLARVVAGSSGPSARWGRVRAIAADPRRLTIAFLLATALAVLTASTGFFSQVTNGSEGFIAGRHNDSFVPIWVASGVATLLAERDRRRLLQLTVGSAAVVLGLSVALVAGRDRKDWDSLYTILNVPDVVHYASLQANLVPVVGAVAVGSLLALAAMAAARRRPAALLPLACAWMIISIGDEIPARSPYEGWRFPAQVEALKVDRAAIYQTEFSGLPVGYLYFFPSLTAVPWDGRGRPPETYVLAGLRAPQVADRGGRLVLRDPGFVDLGGRKPVGLWVMPGPEQRRLAAEDRLLPNP